MMARVTLPLIAPSLGGVTSLMTQPAKTSHSLLDPVERRRIGVTDELVRMSVGIESTEDLLSDLDEALA